MAAGDKKAVSDAKVLSVAEALLASEPRPRQPIRYTGDLTKPIVRPAPLLAGKGLGRAFWLSPEEVQRENKKREAEINAERVRRLELLFDYFDLQHGDYTGLALALALGHVPGLQVQLERKRGRPPDIKKLWESVTRQRQRGKPGRPRNFTPEVQRMLVASADQWKAKQRATGIKRPSDASYVLHLCDAEAETQNRPKREVRGKYFRSLVNDLSRARKVVSKP